MRPSATILCLLPMLPALAALPVRAADAPPAPAQPSVTVPAPAAQSLPSRLVEHLRVIYLLPSAFSPAAMRYPLHRDAAADLKRARAEAEAHPIEGDLRLQAARLAEETDDENAPRDWQSALGLTEAALKARPEDIELRECQVEALIGVNAGARAVPAAERLVAARPTSWRAHLLAADAYVRRMDGDWRTVARLATAGKAQGSPQLAELNGDLVGAEKEYARAEELAPTEGAPRGGRIALALSRPMMTALLPPGLLPGPPKTDLEAIHKELLDWVLRSPGQSAPVWHLAHFFATHAIGGMVPTAVDREAFEQATAQVPPAEAGFLAEARGMLAVARGDWATARTLFAAAQDAMPERRLATGWLALAETRSEEPVPARLERLRARPGAATRSEDQTAIGVLLTQTDRPAALEILRGALKLDVNNPGARYALAVVLLQGQPDSSEARHHLEVLWQSQPEDPEATFAFFVTRLMDGEVGASRQALKEMPRLQALGTDLQARVQAVLEATPEPMAKIPGAQVPATK